MGHGDCFDTEYARPAESHQQGGEGERDYFDHIRGYKVSTADNMLVIAAFAFLIFIGFGIHMAHQPTSIGQTPAISAALASDLPRAADACDDQTPYSGNAC